MCKNSKIIRRVKNGELSICHSCKNYTLTFNNIFFQFSKEQLYKFKIYVSQIDVNYLTERTKKLQLQDIHDVPYFDAKILVTNKNITNKNNNKRNDKAVSLTV